MKRLAAGRWPACLVLSLLLASVLASAAEMSIAALVANPAQFDGKTVTLQGVTTAVKATTSKQGNDYTTFQLKDAGGRSVTVFSWGHPEIKDGSSVQVVGVFQQTKKVGPYIFYNQIDAQSVRPLAR